MDGAARSEAHGQQGDIERIADSMNVHALVDRVVKKIVSSLNDCALHARASLPAEKVSTPGLAGKVAMRPYRAGGNGTKDGNDAIHDSVGFF
jgi:hypothetical protein